MRHYYPQDWDGSGTTYSVKQHSKDLAAFASKMSPPVRIVAHSYGGSAAFEMAREHPELVSKLVLAEAAIYGLLPPPTAQQLEDRAKFAQATEALLKTKGPGAAMEFGVDTLNGKGAFAKFPPLIQEVHRDNAWTLIAGAREALSQASQQEHCANFGSLKMPVLLTTGAATGARFKQVVAQQGKCLPAAKTVVIPNTGHQMTGQPAFVAAVGEFLR